MNKKRLLKKVGSCLLLLSLVTTLSSCSIVIEILTGYINDNLSEILGNIENNYSSFREIDTPYEEIVKNEDLDRAGYNISLIEEKENEGFEILPSTGTQKVLVIPVYFKDYKPSDCMEDPLVGLENINKAFFGKSEDTGWESVKSYYEKSSYGKLILEGTVTSWCPINITLKEFISLKEYKDPTIYVLREATKWVKANFTNICNEYDQDKDGYIDSVCLVYANEYYDQARMQKYDKYYTDEEIEDINEYLWAYTYWDYEFEGNINSPIANCYSWLSYDFLWDGKYSKTIREGFHLKEIPLVDTHTYIHEFGHLLGLDDYYSYDFNDYEPLGKLDMMDNNIGDHNAYSKYLLNWINPQVINKEGRYTISTLTKDGNNALLLPASLDKFNYSPFSEYLLFELYTPTELNKLDSEKRYKGGTSSIPYMFTKTGVKISHVDSRLVVTDELNKTYYYTNIFNNTRNHPNKVQFIGPSNTSSYSINEDFKLINLISSENGRNAFDSYNYATNKDLFYKDDIMTEFSFNSGTELEYAIQIVFIDEVNQTAVIDILNK